MQSLHSAPLAVCLFVAFGLFGCGADDDKRAESPWFLHLPNSGHSSSETPPYGWLSVQSGQLKGQDGHDAQLRGMSSHGLVWYSQFVNDSSLRWLQQEWHINVFRAAMMIDPEVGGYVQDSSQAYHVQVAVEAAVKAGIYVIIDWHVLGHGDPNTYRQQAKQFFSDMAGRYGHLPNVLFEICNEPNGANVHWGNKIKPYAMDIIPVIRAKAPGSVILVGTGSWSQDIEEPSYDPLAFGNVMYVVHFYAGSHKKWLRDRIDEVLQRRTPVFISEWGTSNADGNGGPFTDEADAWLHYLHHNRISFVNWSLADKSEGSAALSPGASPWGWVPDSGLSNSGRYVRDKLRREHDGPPPLPPLPPPPHHPRAPHR